ncbi:MAG: hypothetical protein WA667_04870 [Candidatus Nitrosopolaris sp.]
MTNTTSDTHKWNIHNIKSITQVDINEFKDSGGLVDAGGGHFGSVATASAATITTTVTIPTADARTTEHVLII